MKRTDDPDTFELGGAQTLAQSNEPVHPASDSISEIEASGRMSLAAERYADRKLLGEGGMGEVRLVKDQVIGRDVALKTIRGQTQPASLERFLREARVQAQLEHPAVVPVYDIGTAADGRLFFTMKRVRGRSLESILAGLAAGDEASIAAFPRRRLLNAFVQVCLAMEYAHSRGVLHRDLKPANIMLGDFGEVHVLDWGLARVRGVPDPLADEGKNRPVEVPELGAAGKTVERSMKRTPGYMPPEQAKGKVAELDERADVYSLGVILFELLFLEPLFGQESAMGRLTQTVMGPSPAIAERKRARQVPPELVSLCERTTALATSERPRSARLLANEVERYLDGERDASRRAELAEAHVARAKAHEDAHRLPDALRELGQALALVPTHTTALSALRELFTNLPTEMPPEARGELDAVRRRHKLSAARTSAVRLFTWLLAVPLVIAFGVTDWNRGAVVLGTLGVATLIATVAWRGEHTSERWTLALGIASSAALATFSFVLGPFVVVPGLASTNAMFFAMTSEKELRPAWLALGILAIAVPFVLALLGLDPHYSVVDDALSIRSTLSHLPLEGTLLFLLVTSLATVITPTVLAGRMRDRLAQAEERVFVQAWHLKHLLPEGAGTG